MTNPKRKGILSGITRPSKPLTGGATKAALASALTKIRPGDRVAFKGQRGVVQQITERLIVVRHDLRYGFSVLAKELLQTPIEINGQRLQLTAIERKEEEPVELLTEYEVLDRQVDGVTEPVEPASEESDVHVPEGQDWRKYLTPEGYVRLKAAGWNDNRAMQACRIVSRPVLTAWKKEHGLDGLRLSTNGTVPLNDRFFQESLQRFSDEPACHQGNVTQVPAAEHNCTCGGTCGDQCKCAGEASTESAASEPDEWEWFGAELRARGSKDAFISISGKEIRISSAASVAAGFERGQKVAVGIGKGGLALRRSDTGIPLVGRGAPQSSATQMGACSIVELLIARGWTVPCKLEAEWDAKRGILIGYRNRKAVG